LRALKAALRAASLAAAAALRAASTSLHQIYLYIIT